MTGIRDFVVDMGIYLLIGCILFGLVNEAEDARENPAFVASVAIFWPAAVAICIGIFIRRRFNEWMGLIGFE